MIQSLILDYQSNLGYQIAFRPEIEFGVESRFKNEVLKFVDFGFETQFLHRTEDFVLDLGI